MMDDAIRATSWPCAVILMGIAALLMAAPGAAHAQQGTPRAAESSPSEPATSRPSLTRNERREQLEEERSYMEDENGRFFRVAFPLYERAFVEGQLGILPGSTRALAAPGLRLGLAKSFALDFSDEDIWWMMRHRFLDTTYVRRAQGEGRLDMTLVRGQYLRHDLSAFIVVPAANDLRLPANFDIATDHQLFDIELSRRVSSDKRSWSINQLQVADIALMMDFIRDEDYRHRFAVGIAGGYGMQPREETWLHEVSALTSAKVLYGWDRADGRFHAYTEAVCGAALSFDASNASDTQDWRWRCRGLMEVEWTFLAISDRPLSLPLEVRADIPLDGDSPRAVEATLGLRLSFSK